MWCGGNVDATSWGQGEWNFIAEILIIVNQFEDAVELRYNVIEEFSRISNELINFFLFFLRVYWVKFHWFEGISWGWVFIDFSQILANIHCLLGCFISQFWSLFYVFFLLSLRIFLLKWNIHWIVGVRILWFHDYKRNFNNFNWLFKNILVKLWNNDFFG